MLKIQRSSNGEVIFRLAGRLNEEHVAEMEAILRSEAATREMILKDLTWQIVTQSGFLRGVKQPASSLRIVQLSSASGAGENEGRGST